MSKTYLCFNDESGSLEDKNCKFYVRASLVVNSEQIKEIENKIVKIREDVNLSSLDEEIKWQDLWKLRKYFKNNTNPKDKRLMKIYGYLCDLEKDYHLLIDYCDNILKLLIDENLDVRIILTFTDKEKYPNHKKEDIFKFHIQDHLQRLQMQFQSNNSLVIVVYDSISEQNKKLFKEIYKIIITKGDFVKDYSVVFKSLLFDDSYDNIFLQLADFIAGSFAGTLASIKKNAPDNYNYAINFFKDYIYPRLRKTKKNEIWGAGITEVPKNKYIRENYKNQINNLINSNAQHDIRIFSEDGASS